MLSLCGRRRAPVGPGRGPRARARTGARFRRGAVEPGARLADAGLPLGGELVAFLGGACLARPVLRVEPGSMCGAALLVAGGVLGGVMASVVRLGACRGGWLCARPAVAGLSALPCSMLLARLSVAVGFCRPVLAVKVVLIVRVPDRCCGGVALAHLVVA